jgi:serine/threonine protein kinase
MPADLLAIVQHKQDQLLKILERLQFLDIHKEFRNSLYLLLMESLRMANDKRPQSLFLHCAEASISGDTTNVLPIASSDLDIHELIGRGGYADVHRATWKTSNNMTVAVKQFHIHYLTDEKKKSFHAEIDLMYRVRCDQVLKVLGTCLESHYCAIIVELMPFGSLSDFLLQKEQYPLSWRQKWFISLEMTKAIDHLHCLQPPILHRDIKSSNFFVQQMDEGLWGVKVGDFGLAVVCHEASQQSLSTTQNAGEF